MGKSGELKKIMKIILLSIGFLIIILFLVRLISPREIDDITPGIPCEKEYIEEAEYLWVIPNFEEHNISEYPQWCEEISSLNKTIGMHGISHTYREFKRKNITQRDLDEGIKIFEDCFGYKPRDFKFPQLRYTKENKKLLKQNNITIRSKFSQFTHKVYHCNDSGIKNPKFGDIFKGIIANKYVEKL